MKPTPVQVLNALRELELCTRHFIEGKLVCMPAALLPQCRAIIAGAEAEHDRATLHLRAIQIQAVPEAEDDATDLRMKLLQVYTLATAALTTPQSFDESMAQSHKERAAELAQDAATRTAQAQIRAAGHE